MEDDKIRKVSEKALRNEVEEVYRKVGDRILTLRDALGWTQEELAQRVQMARSSIANIEAGNQRMLLGDIERFAKAFHVSPKHLLRGIWL